MKEQKTYRKIDSCLRVVDPVLMITEECDPSEIPRVWHYSRDIIIIGKNFVRIPSKNNKTYINYVLVVSRTVNKSESADELYAPSKPKGGPRCHKKKTSSSEDYVPETAESAI